MKDTMKKLLFIFLLALPMISFGQSRQVWVHHADEYFEAEDFYSALLNYEKAWSDTIGLQEVTIPYEVVTSKLKLKDDKNREIDSTRKVPIKDYIQHQIAACHLRTFDYNEAVHHFEHTASFKSYPEDVYNFAVSQMNVKNHKEAVVLFEQYIKSNNYSDSLLRSAQLLIKGCFYAMDDNNFKKKIEVKMLDTNVFNSGMASFAPAFFGSEDKLMFTSARNGGVIFDPEVQQSEYLCDLYWTEKDLSGNWSRAINYGRPLNSAQHDASSSFNQLKRNEEQSLIYYTKWNDENRLEQSIYFGRMVGMKFYESFKLPESVNVPGFKSINPFISLDEKTLYFSSNRPGGEGGMDLWKIELDETGNVVGEAINLGRPVNSELNEVSPFYHEPSSTFFFSSNGHNSIGGLDIFKSSYNQDNKAFGTPENMGMPINSSMDDSYIIWDALMEKGYFASDRAPCENGHCYDIYEITNEPIIITLEGIAYDIETDEILPNTNLKFKDINSTIPFENRTILTDAKGYYKIPMDKAQRIYIMATRKSYFAAAESVSTMPITRSTALIQDFYLGPIGEDEIELDGIEYGFDSSALRTRSKEVLDELCAFLQFNGNLVVEINSHTDSRGPTAYNRKLAERRAQSCVDYLISKGIPQERLVAKGYGEDSPNFLKDAKKKPILDDSGERIYLVEKYIKSQPTEEVREEYHQRNRRTAFKVIGEGFNMKSL
ncbi:MAG: outer membrane protein OmpA-like peptidoglycan-associated protein [Salibacteraceae bacterium]|jgi:outer membrane protein OmpA-like peptidoglycan-associated protein/tetratricopeptide (TPR) repeat protein